MKILKKINRYRNIQTKKIKLKLNLLFMNFCYRKRDSTIAEYNNVCFFMHTQAIGDSIITSGLIERIRRSGKKVFIVGPEKIRFLFNSIIEADGFYSFNKKKIPELIIELNKLDIDLVIDTFDFDHSVLYRLKTLFLLKPKKSISFGHPKGTIFDVNIVNDNSDAHLSERMKKILEIIRLNDNSYEYSLSFLSDEFKVAHDYANTIKKTDKLVVFNPFGSHPARSLSMEQINKIIVYLNTLEGYKTVFFNLGCDFSCDDLNNVTLNPFKNAGESFALASNADIIITVDTSMVHLASAFNIKQYCIYNNRLNNGTQNNNIMFGPNNDRAVQLTTNEYLQTEDGDDVHNFDVSLLIDAINDNLNESNSLK
ncbi:glycosyltransferase family 9 protein [Providencia alcalifaciens]